jgi:hypothetical protein
VYVTIQGESIGTLHWLCPTCQWIHGLAEILNTLLDGVERDLHRSRGTVPYFNGRFLNRIFIDPEEFPFPPAAIIPVGSNEAWNERELNIFESHEEVP